MILSTCAVVMKSLKLAAKGIQIAVKHIISGDEPKPKMYHETHPEIIKALKELGCFQSRNQRIIVTTSNQKQNNDSTHSNRK